jgi:hypothetical protein
VYAVIAVPTDFSDRPAISLSIFLSLSIPGSMSLANLLHPNFPVM